MDASAADPHRLCDRRRRVDRRRVLGRRRRASPQQLFDRARPGQILVNNVVRWLARKCRDYTHVGFAEIDGDDDGEMPVEMFAVGVATASLAATTERCRTGQPARCRCRPPCARRRHDSGSSAGKPNGANLAEAWERSEGGALEVVLIGGEAGAGKTRLAAEFARHCHDDGAIRAAGDV